MSAGSLVTQGYGNKPVDSMSPVQLLVRFLFQQPLFQSAFLFLLFFVIYSELPLAIGNGKVIPAFLLFPFLIIIWVIIKADIKIKHLYFVFGIGIVAVMSSLFFFGQLQIGSFIFRILQLLFSLVSGVFVTLLIIKMPISLVRNVCFFWVFFIVGGCILERFGIISPVVNAFHELYANTDYFAEQDEFRDLSITGFVRPLFFTSEPSLVGFGFITFASAYVILSTSLKRDLLVLVSAILLLVILGSPTVILTVIFLAFLILQKLHVGIKYVMLVFLGLTAFVLMLAQIPVAGEIFYTLIYRFSDELFEEGTSVYARIYVPYFKTLPVVVEKSPLFGAGYGNHTVLNSFLGYKGELDEFEAQFVRGANAFVNYINYLGLLGTFLVILFIRQFSRIFHPSAFVMVVLFWLFQNQMVGTFATPRSWCYLCIFIAALGLSYIQKEKGVSGYR